MPEVFFSFSQPSYRQGSFSTGPFYHWVVESPFIGLRMGSKVEVRFIAQGDKESSVFGGTISVVTSEAPKMCRIFYEAVSVEFLPDSPLDLPSDAWSPLATVSEIVAAAQELAPRQKIATASQACSVIENWFSQPRSLLFRDPRTKAECDQLLLVAKLLKSSRPLVVRPNFEMKQSDVAPIADAVLHSCYGMKALPYRYQEDKTRILWKDAKKSFVASGAGQWWSPGQFFGPLAAASHVDMRGIGKGFNSEDARCTIVSLLDMTCDSAGEIDPIRLRGFMDKCNAHISLATQVPLDPAANGRATVLGSHGIVEIQQSQHGGLVAVKSAQNGTAENIYKAKANIIEREAKLIRLKIKANQNVLPNIVHFHEGSDKSIGMEFVPLSVTETLDQSEDPTQASERIVCQIAEALDALHEVGCVHLDVRKDNIRCFTREPFLQTEVPPQHDSREEAKDESTVVAKSQRAERSVFAKLIDFSAATEFREDEKALTAVQREVLGDNTFIGQVLPEGWDKQLTQQLLPRIDVFLFLHFAKGLSGQSEKLKRVIDRYLLDDVKLEDIPSIHAVVDALTSKSEVTEIYVPVDSSFHLTPDANPPPQFKLGPGSLDLLKEVPNHYKTANISILSFNILNHVANKVDAGNKPWKKGEGGDYRRAKLVEFLTDWKDGPKARVVALQEFQAGPDSWGEAKQKGIHLLQQLEDELNTRDADFKWTVVRFDRATDNTYDLLLYANYKPKVGQKVPQLEAESSIGSRNPGPQRLNIGGKRGASFCKFQIGKSKFAFVSQHLEPNPALAAAQIPVLAKGLYELMTTKDADGFLYLNPKEYTIVLMGDWNLDFYSPTSRPTPRPAYGWLEALGFKPVLDHRTLTNRKREDGFDNAWVRCPFPLVLTDPRVWERSNIPGIKTQHGSSFIPDTEPKTHQAFDEIWSDHCAFTFCHQYYYGSPPAETQQLKDWGPKKDLTQMNP